MSDTDGGSGHPGPPVSNITDWGLSLITEDFYAAIAKKLQDAEDQREQAFAQTKGLNKLCQASKFAYQRNDFAQGNEVWPGRVRKRAASVC